MSKPPLLNPAVAPRNLKRCKHPPLNPHRKPSVRKNVPRSAAWNLKGLPNPSERRKASVNEDRKPNGNRARTASNGVRIGIAAATIVIVTGTMAVIAARVGMIAARVGIVVTVGTAETAEIAGKWNPAAKLSPRWFCGRRQNRWRRAKITRMIVPSAGPLGQQPRRP